MDVYVSNALMIMGPITALVFLIEYVWTYRLEKVKPKTNAAGGAAGTTPPGYMRSQEQIDKEAVITKIFNEQMVRYRSSKATFDKFKPIVKRLRLYSAIIICVLGLLKIFVTFLV